MSQGPRVNVAYGARGTPASKFSNRLTAVNSEAPNERVRGPDPLRPNGWTTLHHAASFGRTNVASYFLDMENVYAHLNSTDYDGRTPLAVAAQSGHMGVTEELLQRHADPQAIDKDGNQPIHRAVRGGYVPTVDRLMKVLTRSEVFSRSLHVMYPHDIVAFGDPGEFVVIDGRKCILKGIVPCEVPSGVLSFTVKKVLRSEYMPDPRGLCTGLCDEEGNELLIATCFTTCKVYVHTRRAYSLILRFGGLGRGAYEFNGPMGISCEPVNKLVAVCDSNNDRVQLYELRPTPQDRPCSAESLMFIHRRTFAYTGDADKNVKTLLRPHSVMFISSTRMLVSDAGNHRVVCFDVESGKALSTYGKEGTGAGEFQTPTGLLKRPDNASRVLVSDCWNHRVHELNFNTETSQLTAHRMLDRRTARGDTGSARAQKGKRGKESKGNSWGQSKTLLLNAPTGIVACPITGKVYVVNHGSHTMEVL